MYLTAPEALSAEVHTADDGRDHGYRVLILVRHDRTAAYLADKLGC